MPTMPHRPTHTLLLFSPCGHGLKRARVILGLGDCTFCFRVGSIPCISQSPHEGVSLNFRCKHRFTVCSLMGESPFLFFLSQKASYYSSSLFLALCSIIACTLLAKQTSISHPIFISLKNSLHLTRVTLFFSEEREEGKRLRKKSKHVRPQFFQLVSLGKK